MKQGTSRPKEYHVPANRIPPRERIITNIAYLMGDVTDTLMRDAYVYVQRAGYNVKHDIKQRHRYALQATHSAQRAWEQFSRELYTKDSDTDALCEDSDWFADIILLIADRAGDDPHRRDMIRRMLLRLRSTLNIYNQD